jgi:hypothetical protein
MRNRNILAYKGGGNIILEKITRVLLRVKYYTSDEMKKDEVGGTYGTSEEEDGFSVET